MKMEQTECFETSAYKIKMPGNYPEENIQHTEHGESLKSSMIERCLLQTRNRALSYSNNFTVTSKYSQHYYMQ
jgi:hypothetical protein